MAKINKLAIRSKIKLGLKKKNAEQKIYQKVNGVFQRKKQELISEFENHPVTREIKSGAGASNSSGTLSGGYGNLFTFIGFDASADPTSIVTSMLRNDVRLLRTPRKRNTKRGVIFHYRVQYPNLGEIGAATPMPWEPGSWVEKVEKGISGLGYYIYHNYINPNSRSGRGTQSSHKIRTAVYKRVSYMSAILKTFKKGWGRL